MKNWSLVLGAVLILAVAFFSNQINLTGQASTSYNLEYGKYYPEEISLSLDSAGCKWTQDHYEACAQFSWKGLAGFYVKAFIAGGEGLLYSPKSTQSPYVYCQNVGSSPGQKAIQAYLYSSQDALKKVDAGNTVTCNKDLESKTKKITKKYSISIGTSDRVRNEGLESFTGLGGKPVSCKVSGTWKTNNRKVLGNLRKFCHGASGSFNGEFEGGKSYVVNDPNMFDWTDLGSAHDFDPQPTTYEGYLLYAPTCDQTQYNTGRYYARARLTSLDSDGFTIYWEYYNADTRPRLDFIFNVECNVETGETKGQKITAEPVVEEPTIEIPAKLEPEPVATEPVETPKPLIFKLIDWIRSIF